MASPLSSPSESSELSLLGFSYGRDVHEVASPHDHDESQPLAPESTSTVGPLSYDTRHSLGPSRPPQSSRPAEGGEEEYELGAEAGKRERGSQDIDPFSRSELVFMSGSTFLVLALISVSVLLTFGTIVL